MAKKYVVKLKGRERLGLERMLRGGRRESARTLARARVLLKCDQGCTDEEVVDAVGVSLGTVERTRKRLCAGGMAHPVTPAQLLDRPGARLPLPKDGHDLLFGKAFLHLSRPFPQGRDSISPNGDIFGDQHRSGRKVRH